MEILIKSLQLILSLSILVVLHELGHFLPAKWFKTRVEKFYLFFNPGFSLFKKQIGETEYGVGWLPLGGYVKISGMIDESMDKEYLEKEPEPWEFRSKPAWQRLVIMLGGVTVNVILGYLLFTIIAFKWGTTYIPVEQVTNGIYVDSIGYDIGLRTGDKILQIGDKEFSKFNPSALVRGVIIDDASEIIVNRAGVETKIPIDPSYNQILTGSGKDAVVFNARTPFEIGLVPEIRNGFMDKLKHKLFKKPLKVKSPAELAGLKVDDKIIGFNGEKIEFYDQVYYASKELKGQEVMVNYEREGRLDSTLLTLTEEGRMGVYNKALASFFDLKTEYYTAKESVEVGITRGNGFITDQMAAFKKMFSGQIKAKDSLGSFISIGNMFPSKWDWEIFWKMTAMLSLILGILNLMPIPGLDGGHVMFLLWELITGKKANDKVVEYATLVGFILLIALMIFAFGNDIRRVIQG